MSVTLTKLKAIPLTARFSDIFGGEDRIPPEINRPASHFQSIPRRGQFCTIIVCESSDGAVGFGECFGLPTPFAAAEIANRVAAEALVGKHLATPMEMQAELRRFFLALGHSRGPAMEALSGIDIALWDLAARRAGKSLAGLLGAKPKGSATYVSPVPFLPSPDQSAKAAVELAIGYKALKLKIGRSAREDIPHIAAVREALGPGVDLMLDANCGYTLEDATLLVREIESLEIRWLEEPLPPEETENTRKLSAKSNIPIAGGENEFTPEALLRLVSQAGVSVIQPNITRAGGVSGMLETDRLLDGTDARIAPHGVGGCIAVSSTLHVAAAMQRFDVFELNRLPNPLRDSLGHQCMLSDGGTMSPPGGEGHGCALGEEIDDFRDAVAVAAE